jgi:hypothetical protein
MLRSEAILISGSEEVNDDEAHKHNEPGRLEWAYLYTKRHWGKEPHDPTEPHLLCLLEVHRSLVFVELWWR